MPATIFDQEEAVGTETIPEDTENLRNRVVILKDRADEISYYDLSVALYHIYSSEEWQAWGPQDKVGVTFRKFREYVEHDLPGVSYSTAMYRVKIGEAIEQLNLKKDQVLALGWSKFKEVARVLVEEQITSQTEYEKIAETVEKKSVPETMEWVTTRLRKRKGQDPKERNIALKFSLDPDAARFVQDTLTDVGDRIGYPGCNLSFALKALCFMAAEESIIYESSEETVKHIQQMAKKEFGEAGSKAEAGPSPKPTTTKSSKKSTGKKTAGKKTAGKKSTGKKTAGKKTAGKKSTGKKTAGKKTTGKGKGKGKK